MWHLHCVSDFVSFQEHEVRRKINISFLSPQSVFDVLVRRERADVLLCSKLAERDSFN